MTKINVKINLLPFNPQISIIFFALFYSPGDGVINPINANNPIIYILLIYNALNPIEVSIKGIVNNL